MTKLGLYTLMREALRNPDEPTFMRALATLYWRFLLVLVIIACVASLVVGFEELSRAHGSFDEINAPQATPVPPLSRKDIDTVVDGFTARENAYGALKASPISVQNPQ